MEEGRSGFKILAGKPGLGVSVFDYLAMKS
jgi:hypothetical protein